MTEQTLGLYVDMPAEAPAPQPDGFLVSITAQKTIGTVYHIASVRQVNPRTPRLGVRYQLRVYQANDLKPETHYNPHNGRVWVKDQEAIGLTWYPRTKKAKK